MPIIWSHASIKRKEQTCNNNVRDIKIITGHVATNHQRSQVYSIRGDYCASTSSAHVDPSTGDQLGSIFSATAAQCGLVSAGRSLAPGRAGNSASLVAAGAGVGGFVSFFAAAGFSRASSGCQPSLRGPRELFRPRPPLPRPRPRWLPR